MKFTFFSTRIDWRYYSSSFALNLINSLLLLCIIAQEPIEILQNTIMICILADFSKEYWTYLKIYICVCVCIYILIYNFLHFQAFMVLVISPPTPQFLLPILLPPQLEYLLHFPNVSFIVPMSYSILFYWFPMASLFYSGFIDHSKLYIHLKIQIQSLKKMQCLESGSEFSHLVQYRLFPSIHLQALLFHFFLYRCV